ncbi:hypothetical protein B0H14DRAFT_647802 [Mycena olivaceomarginata]|nr:hypothetical protein B0H14DRAFT_647802 [Mycena olivaceomarginata]
MSIRWGLGKCCIRVLRMSVSCVGASSTVSCAPMAELTRQPAFCRSCTFFAPSELFGETEFNHRCTSIAIEPPAADTRCYSQV